MTKYLRLRDPSQMDDAELNIAGQRFTIHADGHFYIPEGVNIEGALKVGGFTLAPFPVHEPAIEAGVEQLAEALHGHPELVTEIAEELTAAATT